MRIFIIGPEGAGKTVFLAMLSHYVATQRKDLILEPIDYASAEYVTRAQQALHLGEWPPSTRQGELRLLRWNFGTSAASLSEMQMLDSAGQDLRQILLEDETFRLTPGQQTIRQMMDQSDFFIYLLDLGSLLATQDMLALTENAWLFKTFLTRPEWQQKKRVTVVSKADIYREALAAQQGDVKSLIKQCIPPHLSLSHLIDEAKHLDYLPLTCVVTTTELDMDGNPIRRPVVPLVSEGFDRILAVIVLSGISNKSKDIRLLNVAAASAVAFFWIAIYFSVNYDPNSLTCQFAILGCIFGHWFACEKIACKKCCDNGITAIYIASGLGVVAACTIFVFIVYYAGPFIFWKNLPSIVRNIVIFIASIIGGLFGVRIGVKIGDLIKRTTNS